MITQPSTARQPFNTQASGDGKARFKDFKKTESRLQQQRFNQDRSDNVVNFQRYSYAFSSLLEVKLN